MCPAVEDILDLGPGLRANARALSLASPLLVPVPVLCGMSVESFVCAVSVSPRLRRRKANHSGGTAGEVVFVCERAGRRVGV